MSTLTTHLARWRLAAVAVAAVALLAGASPAATARAVSGGAWGIAKEVPGTAALNTGGSAAAGSVSCASAGNCSAGGYYATSAGLQAFVVSQVHGTWGTAKEVPGTAALSTGGNSVGLVSCASAGNCSAAGEYAFSQVLVVSQVAGIWGTAKEAPGTAALNTGDNDAIDALSCASAGNCSAGGYYATSAGVEHPFVISQVGGTWRTAKEVPVGTGPGADIPAMSCASAGNCSAGGAYESSSGVKAFVISQVGGAWGAAKIIPGTGSDGFANVTALSCASAGNCSAAGSYTNSAGHGQVFVVSQVHGSWGTAKEASGTAALNTGNNDAINSLSCASPGNCSAAGSYTDSSGHTQAFVATQVHGIWGTAREVPGTAALNKGNAAAVSLSCASAGTCSAGGFYHDGAGHQQAFVVNQVNGAWGTAKEVPGTAALNKGNAAIGMVSCAPAGTCSAGGSYTDSSGHGQAFVVSQT
jgi:hypothetical protein